MNIFRNIKKMSGTNGNFEKLSIGEVVDTNDPQQMGRIRVACAYLGDHEDTIIEDIPWATPISPLAGTTESPARGRGEEQSFGPVAYGMFNTPKVGSFVLIACIEGDPRFRIYLGGLHDQFLLHTLPHGRYTYKKNADLTDEPSGPLTSTENFLEPLYTSQTFTFTKTQTQQVTSTDTIPKNRNNYEYRTRAADNGVAGIDDKFINTTDVFFSREPDDKELRFTEKNGNVIENTHGYHRSRVQKDLESGATGFAYDPQTYSWTTPGFHSISMHDSADNCRLRIRTTHGHQIIMDDTNERIYISTSYGKTWIEMDEKGNIDIYGERNISVHAEKDINFTAGGTFRVKAKEGIHLASEGEMRFHAIGGNLHLKSGGTTNIHSIGNMSISVPDLFLTAQDNVHIKATGGILNLESGANTNILAGGNILQTGSQIHFNGPPADSATDSIPSDTFDAWWTNRVPEHEPWARTMTTPDNTDQNIGNTHTNANEYTYNDTNVGKMERGFDLNRNPRWHR